MRAWYRENVAGRGINGPAEHERFMDYWRAQPGQKGVKQDWPATWRNWMRSAVERAGRAPAQRGPRSNYTSAAERQRASLDRVKDLALIAEAIVEARGGNPESAAEVHPLMSQLKADPALVEQLLPVLDLAVGDRPEALRMILAEIHRRQNRNGSASRTPTMYSIGDGHNDGQVEAPEEVTGHAGERDAGTP